jgi:hypothetical protein
VTPPGDGLAPVIDATRTRLLPEGIKLVFETVPGNRYGLEVSDDLTNWRELGTVTAVGTQTECLDSTLSGSMYRFYRVKATR